MFEKNGKQYADWRTSDGVRQRKSFDTSLGPNATKPARSNWPLREHSRRLLCRHRKGRNPPNGRNGTRQDRG